ncbi:MAG: hypothetical protein EBZ59_03905 [Planctomycetia bacterium]|nr:hypothetical protein [Planctomycetia bacterium]
MTRLKALELFGFKSFADRTRFEFPEGITVVVGPNGSGKSNVVDALKWVLGEQSARSLRGREMADVIFAGSAARRPLNVAEVSLIFDNSARLLPVEADEVQVMRRVYRSGESEYLVNGEASRLRDIRELFSGTGVATEAYSVIEQGRVDALLVASGRDRRAIFEEAAGITRFRSRRAEALRRLERSEQNRQRLADIVGEVSSRLETVRHQAARARRWRQMTDRLRGLRLSAAARDLAEVDAAVALVDDALADDRRALAAVEERAAQAAVAAAALETLEQDLQPRLAATQSTVAAERQRAAAAESTLAMLRSRRRELEGDAVRLEGDVQAASTRERAAVAAVEAGRRDTQRFEAEARGIEERLERCTASAAGTHHDFAAARERLASGTRVIEALERRRAALGSELDRADERLGEAGKAIAAWRERIDAAALQRARLLETHATWDGNLAALGKRMQDVVAEIESLEESRRAATESLEAAWSDLSGWRAKLEACRERRTLLEEMAGRQEGLSDAARGLLAVDADGVPGLGGVLADLVVADVEWAPLADLALGTMAQSLVVDSLDDVVGWYGRWASSAAAAPVLSCGGRVGFISASALREPPDFDPGTAPDGAPAVVGRLDRLLAADSIERFPRESHRTLVRRLLGRVWVVERVEQARRLAAAAPPGMLFLTRAGHAFSSDGGFEFGTATAAAGMVARRSELRAVGLRYEELTRTVDAAAETVDRIQVELADVGRQVREAQTRRQQAAEAMASCRAECARLARERDAADAAIASNEAALVAAERLAVDLGTARDQAAVAVADCDRDIDAARDELARSQSAVEAIDRSRDEVLEEIGALRIAQATCRERLARGIESAAAQAAARESRVEELRTARGSWKSVALQRPRSEARSTPASWKAARPATAGRGSSNAFATSTTSTSSRPPNRWPRAGSRWPSRRTVPNSMRRSRTCVAGWPR